MHIYIYAYMLHICIYMYMYTYAYVYVADPTAPGHPGVRVADKPGSFNGTFLRLSADREPSRPYPIEPGDAFGLGCVGPGGLGHWLTLVAEEGEHYLQARQ